ncbi:uncharacterized protein [Palaemon carinicauda]|uniref:uncharacterized protein n=1 Tax=Palaemon carinicauda TaxID=392227 RepID=UPI0035B62AA8
MTLHKMEKTGRSNVSIHLTWGDETADFFDYVWVYRPIAKPQVLFAVTSSVVVPPGNISALITITDSTELPTMIMGSILWGDEQMTSLNLTQLTLPGSSGAASWTEEHIYEESRNFTVTLTLNNPVSLVSLNRTVITTEKLSLQNVTIRNNDGSLAPSTLTSGSPVVFELIAESGIVRMYILKIGAEVVRSLQRQIPYEFQKPGRYEVTAEISGPAGVSEAFAIEVDVQAALRNSDVVLETPSLVVFPPGNGTIYIEITSDAYLPTHVHCTISWGDKGPSTYIDLRNETGPEATGSVRKALVHTYAEAGSYDVLLFAYNNVSSVNVTKSVTVVDHLTLDDILVSYVNEADITEWQTDILKTDVGINFTAVVASGEAAYFDLVVDNTTIQENGPSIHYAFNSAGNYVVKMISYGEAGASPPVETTVVIYRPILQTDIKLNVSELVVWPEGKANITITLTSAGELPTRVSGYITWEGDIQDGDIQGSTEFDMSDVTAPGSTGSVSKVLEFSFRWSGVYNATAHLKNNVSLVLASKQIRVIDHITLKEVTVAYADATDAPNWYTEVFKTGVSVNITAVVDTGDVEEYTLHVNDEILKSSGPSFTYTFSQAGEYNISMIGSGEAGESPAVSTLVAVARSLLQENVNLVVPSLVVWPTGEALVTIQLNSTVELPTRVTGSVDWGDGDPVTPIDWKNLTLPGKSGVVSEDFVHLYTTEGNYTITFMAENEVSRANVTGMVRVINDLTLNRIAVTYKDPADEPGWNTTWLKAGVDILFSAIIDTGKAASYYLYVEGEPQPIASPNSTIVYRFALAGEYQINMSCSGEAGVSANAVTKVKVAIPISPAHPAMRVPSLVVLPPGEANVTVTLTSDTELPTYVVGAIDWGDGEPETRLDFTNSTAPLAVGSASLDLLHNYTAPGEVTILLHLRNPVSLLNLTDKLNVLASLVIGGIHIEYENPSDSPPWYSTVFKAHVPLNLTALVQAGQSEEYKLQVEDKIMTSPTPSFVYTFLSSGDYTLTMQTSGDAGDSNTLSSLVQIAQPLTTDNTIIEIPEYIVFPPGDINITLSLTAFMNEVATNVTGWMTWGDTSGEEEKVDTNLLKDTGPGATGPVSLALVHQYADAGQFVITWFLRNPVSEINVTKAYAPAYPNNLENHYLFLSLLKVPILTQLKLGPLVVQPLDEIPYLTEGFYLPSQKVNITPSSVAGKADRYVLSVPELEDIVQENKEFLVSFEAESDYEVSMRGEDSSGFSDPVSTFVRIRQKVSGLKMEVSHIETRVMLEVTFKIEVPILMGSCVSLDVGEDTETIPGWRQDSGCEGQESGIEEWRQPATTGRITLVHKYSSPGIYTPVARFFSAMGEELTADNITVYESLPCSELTVWIPRNGTVDRPINMTRADKLRIQSSSVVNCSASDLSMEIEWRVIRINDSMEVDLGDADIGKGVLFLQRRSLHYGVYRAVVSYNVSMTNPSSGIPVWATLESDSVVNVGQSELMVVIVGGGAPRIRRGNLQTLSLRPMQYSYDPDYPEIPLVSYVWSCHLAGEKLPDRSVTSDPPLSRDAYENSIDHGGCWGQGPGWLTNQKGSLSIDVDLFRNVDKVYKMGVIASSNDGRNSSSSVEIEVVEGNPPALISYCNPPWFCVQVKGAQLVNPTKLILESEEEIEEGNEDSETNTAPLNFTWTVYGVNLSPDSSESLKLEGVAVGTNNRKLALLDGFWETYGSSYKYFDVEVTANRVGEDAKGLAIQRIQINEAPTGGSCIATLSEEVADGGESEFLETKMVFTTDVPTLEVTSLIESVLCNCTGWADPEGFEISKYSFYGLLSTGEKMVFSFGTDSKGTVVLPHTNMTLWAAVADNMGAETSYLMAHIVPILPTKESFDEYMGRNELVKAAGARDQTRVDMLLKAENSLKGVELPTEGDDADGLGESESEDELENKVKEKNQKMLGSLDSFTTTSMEEVIQVNSILNSVADPLPKDQQEGAVDTLVKLSRAKDREAPLSLQKDFMAGALSTTANLLNGVNKEVNSSRTMNSTTRSQEMVKRMRRSIMRASNASLDYYDDTEEEDQESEEFYEPSEDDMNANEKVGKMLDVVGNSQSALLEAAVSGEEPAIIEAGDKVNVAVAFFDASELKGKQVEIGGATYVFPSYCAIMREDENCLVNKSISVGVKMTKWKGQVHGYGGGRDQLSEDSSTLQLSLVDTNLNPIPVEDTLEDFIMYIPRAQETVSEPEIIDPNVSGLGLSVHNIYVPAPRVGVSVFMRPENDSDIDDWIVTWSSSRLNGTPEYMDDVMYLTSLPYHNDTGFYELFLDSDVIGKVTGMYSIGFGRYNYTVPEILEHPCFEDPPNNTVLLSFDTQFDTNYSLSTFVSSCLFFNNDLLTWSSDGCKVIGATATVTICSCNHLTSFGSGFFVTPNTIDFSYVFANAGFADNLTIYLVLIISLALYLIGLVYARIMDKRDVEKVGATPLPDNDPEDQYLYDVMVHTGHFPGAGTKSKVQFLLVGDWNETDVRTLNEDTKRPLLTRGASDHFILANDRPLGPLQYLRIWHDNSGKGKTASWYFAYMVVRDLQSGEEFQFICNTWLAVEEGDGLIDRLIPVAGDEQKRDRAHVFSKTVEKNLSDDHLWFSVVLRPARSRFTRVQRLSSCMALLYLSMLVNAMFYERVPDTPGAGGLNLGFFSVSPEAMGVGFISNLIVFPPSFIIVFFFRKARPRRPKASRLREALIKQNLSQGEDTKETQATPTKKGQFNKPPMDKQKTPLTQKPVNLEAESKIIPAAKSESGPQLKESKSLEEKPSSVISQSSHKQLLTSSSSGGKEENSQEVPYRRKKKLTLPWWCVIIAWVLCAISILVAVFFLWAYGIQFGNEKATKWLTALISSIFSSVLLTQPIKIYLTAMLLSYICKKPLNEHEDYDDDEEDFDVDSDEAYLHGPPTGHSSRRRAQIQVGPGMSPEELEAARVRREKEVAMQSLIFEIGVYSIFLTIILSVGYGSRDPNIFLMRQNVVNTFVESQVGGSQCPTFSKAAKESDFWCWGKEILIPNLMDPYLYNGEHRPQTMCGTMIDRVNFLLGHPIFRQIRKLPGPSHQHPVNHPRDEDERDFGLGWNVTENGPPHYIYKSSLQLHGFPYDGILDSYSGGGYLVEIRGPHYKALHTLDRLENEGWMDQQTKAVFVEFAFYNPQVNLFGVVMFVFEFFDGGGFLAKFKFQGLSLLRYHRPGGFYILLSEIAYLIFTFFYTRREYKSLKKLGRSYFKSAWNILEIAILVLSYTAIIFYLLKTSLTYYTIDKFTASKGKKYIRMQPLAFLDDVVGYIISFQVFIGTLKLLKLLRFNKRIGMLSATLKYAAGDILGFTLLFIIMLFSFSSIFYLNSLTYVEEFSTFTKTVEASFFLINKKFLDIKESSPILGPIFYFIFAFMLYWLVFQLLIAIICHAFAHVSNNLSAQPNDYEVVEYLMTRVSAYIRAFFPNSVREVNIQPPRGPDVDSQLRHLHHSLDKVLDALDRASGQATPSSEKGKRGRY